MPRNVQRIAFRDLLEFCVDEEIELKIFTTPLHADMLDIECDEGKNFAL